MYGVWEDEDEEAEDPILALFGEDLLRFVLNGVDLGDVQPEDRPRREALGTLGSIAERVPDTDPINQRHFLDAQLTRGTSSGMTLVNAMRRACGGNLPLDLSSDHDPVASALHDMAVFGFALELLPVPPGDIDMVVGPSQRYTGVSLRRPFQDCYTRILEDPELSLLFPQPAVESLWNMADPMESRFRSANLYWSTGSGGTTHVGALPPSMLSYLFVCMRLAGELEIMAVPGYVARTVTTIRRLASKRQTRVPMVVPLGNFELDANTDQVLLSRGKIVPATDLADRVPGVLRVDDAVLVMETDLKLLDVVPIDAGQDDEGNTPSEFTRRVQHRQGVVTAAIQGREFQITAARLAIAMATRKGALVAPTVCHREVINPLVAPTARGWASGPSSGMPYEELPDSSAAEVLRCSEVTSALPTSMALGARRLVSAIGERMDPLDAFVDAVVSWENFLGSETEVTFRVCAALAKLVEPDDLEERRVLFDELRRLYRVRSALVHGGQEPSAPEAAKLRDRAVYVGLAALEAISELPELWHSKDSGERNRRVLLGI